MPSLKKDFYIYHRNISLSGGSKYYGSVSYCIIEKTTGNVSIGYIRTLDCHMCIL